MAENVYLLFLSCLLPKERIYAETHTRSQAGDDTPAAPPVTPTGCLPARPLQMA